MAAPFISYFHSTILHLRQHEEMAIYDRFTPDDKRDERPLVEFLQTEYQQESLEYPGVAPAFEVDAAIWAARTVYVAAQLLLFRKEGMEGTKDLLPAFAGRLTPGGILSADVCLRFLPDIARKTRELSPEDWLVDILEAHLQQWHYSGVGYPLKADMLDWEMVFADDCVRQCYVDRVIVRKAKTLAQLPVLRREVDSALGNWANYFWEELSMNI